MNVSTKTWLLEQLDGMLERNRKELGTTLYHSLDYQIQENRVVRIAQARRLVEQCPEEPTR
jgi:hypothetical protein